MIWFHPMLALLARLGYRLSDATHDLDEDDPELIYTSSISTYLCGWARSN